MVQIIHTPEINGKPYNNGNAYLIIGDNIDEIINLSLTKIRPKSQDAAIALLKEDLKLEKQSIINRHAGSGCFYDVKLVSTSEMVELCQDIEDDKYREALRSTCSLCVLEGRCVCGELDPIEEI